jgi:hypothetical protein
LLWINYINNMKRSQELLGTALDFL